MQNCWIVSMRSRKPALSCPSTAILSDPRGTLTGRDYRRVSLISKARGWSSLDRWSARLDCHITLDRNFGLWCLVVSKCRNANDNSLFFFYLFWTSRDDRLIWSTTILTVRSTPSLWIPVRGFLAPVALDLVSENARRRLSTFFHWSLRVERVAPNERPLSLSGLSFRFPPNPCEKSANSIIPLLLPNKRVWIRFL